MHTSLHNHVKTGRMTLIKGRGCRIYVWEEPQHNLQKENNK